MIAVTKLLKILQTINPNSECFYSNESPRLLLLRLVFLLLIKKNFF